MDDRIKDAEDRDNVFHGLIGENEYVIQRTRYL